MTYGKLSKVKTSGFTTNHVIDDEVNNARWAYSKKTWEAATVPDYVLLHIIEWAEKEGVQFPLMETA